MLSIDHLHVLRAAELDIIASHLPPGGRILELGAGTGAQARALVARGFRVSAVDVHSSAYTPHRVFEVIDFDGRRLPFQNGRFDAVFSSNVLEHVPDLDAVHQEITRVLTPGGYCVHVLPSSAWRFWTSVSAFPNVVPTMRHLLPQLKPAALSRAEIRRLAPIAREAVRELARPFVPVRHGEFGNALTELWRFSRMHWMRHFRAHGFVVERVRAMGLFYTGYMYFGADLDLETRERLAKVLGSACNLFVVRPGARSANATI
jgi:SAM-dependent methyltransferase